jgi:amino acid adenylation domain-containing protein
MSVEVMGVPAAGGLEWVDASAREQALWLLGQLAPDSGASNIPLAFRVAGRLRWWPVQVAVNQLLRRHEVLRTCYLDAEGGGPVRRAVRAADQAAVDVEVIQSVDGRLEDDLTAFAARPFRPDGGPLVRAALLLCPSGDAFCLVVHHSVGDGRSLQVLTKDLVALVRAAADERPVPAELDAEVPTAPPRDAQPESLAYWRRQLAGADGGSSALAFGGEAPDTPTLRGERIVHQLGGEAHAAVGTLVSGLRASPHMVLLAAFYVLLARHGAGPDVVVGCPVDVRGPDRADAVGYHVNTIALRQTVDLDLPFTDLVRQVRSMFLEAVEHADTSVDLVLPEIPRHGASWTSTLFRHMFNFMPVDRASDVLSGIGAHPVDVHTGFSRFDVEFFVQRAADSTAIRTLYGTDVFTAAEVRALLRRYEAILASAAADPSRPAGDLTVHTDDDRRLLDRANDTGSAAPAAPTADAAGPAAEAAGTVLRSVERAALARPDAVAVRQPGDGANREVGYGELWRSARRVAARLRRHGIRPGDVVAVAASRDADTVAALLGTHLAGAAYLPVDPHQPPRRVAHVLTDATPAAILADPASLTRHADSLATIPVLPLATSADPDGDEFGASDRPGPGDLAYLIYTSGSTGVPKGVRVSHGNLANVVGHFGRVLEVGTATAVGWLTPLTFDISALEVFLPLAHGAPLVVIEDDARLDGGRLRDVVRGEDVAVVQATPTTWHHVLAELGDGLAGRTVLCGGEPMPPALARRLVATGARVLNVYGPTETTIWSTAAEIDGTGPVTAGTPIAGTTVFIADRQGREVPPGVLGELTIAGAGVALGYHNAPELTADRFRRHPVHGRCYRTGDLARWDADGRIVLAGRTDRQVKVRGNRVELDEIEAVLLTHPEVREAGVVVERPGEPDARLVAVVRAEPRDGLADDLWRHAGAALPAAVVPHEFRVVDRLPTTANGKLDRSALLTAPARERPVGPAADPPGDAVATLARLWGEVLRRDDLGADANFFLSGGHSLLGVVLLREVRTATGVRVKLSDLFDRPTPRQLAALITREGQ